MYRDLACDIRMMGLSEHRISVSQTLMNVDVEYG